MTEENFDRFMERFGELAREARNDGRYTGLDPAEAASRISAVIRKERPELFKRRRETCVSN